MITKITNTPFVSYTPASHSIQSFDRNLQRFNLQPARDTVSFTANPVKKLTEDVVNKAFMKLCENRLRTGNNLGIFGTRKGDVNLFIQEKVFGKRARLTLSNGDFNGRSYLNFDLKRTLRKYEITPVDADYTPEESAKIINLYLD